MNILAYDYRGYGISQGECCEENMYKDIEIVISFAINKLYYKLD